MGMTKSDAAMSAAYNWGPNAFAVRAKETQRNLRYRVGFASNHEGKSKLYILGMGTSWEEAFSTASEHPMCKPQMEKVAALRKQYTEKSADMQFNNQQEETK